MVAPVEMKKIVTSIIIFVFLSSSAYGFVQIALPLVGSLALHVAGAAGIYYYMKSGSTSSVSSVGDISRSSQVTWVSLDSSGVATTKTVDVTAKIPAATVKQIAQANQSSYPQLATAQNTITPPAPAAGVVMKNPVTGISYRFTGSVNIYNGPGSCAFSTAGFNSTTRYIVCTTPGTNPLLGNHGESWEIASTALPETPGTVTPRSAPEVATALAQTGSSGPVKSLYQAELDKMMQDPNYVPIFTSDTTGLPYSPPADAMTPAQIDLYNKSGISKEAAGTASTSSGNSATSAGAAATNAGNAYTASGGNTATGVGGDPALYQKYLEQKAIADRAQAAKDKLAADQAATESAKLQSGNISTPGTPDPFGDGSSAPGSSHYSTRFNGFITDMKSSGLFALPTQFLGNIPGGGTSVFNLDFGRMGKTTFDLASYSTGISIIRILVLFVFSVCGFKIITLKGGSG